MFTWKEEQMNKPVRIWLENIEEVEEVCLEQARHLAQLPFIHTWACLMPDTGEIMRNIPVGYNSYKKRQESEVLDRCLAHAADYEKNETLFPLIEDAFYQIGTLGGGNHFIELQEDQDGYLGVMIHSGSRHFGKEICDHFHNRARVLNTAWHSAVPDSYRLAFLPVDSAEGQDYILWMNLALEYAFENRRWKSTWIRPWNSPSRSIVTIITLLWRPITGKRSGCTERAPPEPVTVSWP